MNIFLIDGTFELFRAYYAGIPGSTLDGQANGAVRGVLRSIISLIRSNSPCFLAVAFDTVIESFRNDLFEGYKTGEGIDPILWNQFSMVEEALRAMGITVWSMIDYEADDALASAAVKYIQDARVDQVVICTPDKDLAQVIRANQIISWDRIRNTYLDESAVEEKFGVKPTSIPDLLALVGDKADGVPGIPRWGMKSSAVVLQQYGKLEAIPNDEAEWQIKPRGAKGLASSLSAHRKEAELYKTLTTLKLDVPLKENLDQLQWKGINEPLWEMFAQQLNDRNLEALIRKLSI